MSIPCIVNINVRVKRYVNFTQKCPRQDIYSISRHAIVSLL